MILDKDFKAFNSIFKGEENNGILQWENKKKKELEELSYEKIRNELERLEEKLEQLKYNNNSQKTVAEQIFKEFLILLCSLLVTTIFSILDVMGDVVATFTGYSTSEETLELSIDLFMEYVSGTLSMSTLIAQIFFMFLVVSSLFHIILFVYESKQTEKKIREIRFYNHLINLCKEKVNGQFDN